MSLPLALKSFAPNRYTDRKIKEPNRKRSAVDECRYMGTHGGHGSTTTIFDHGAEKSTSSPVPWMVFTIAVKDPLTELEKRCEEWEEWRVEGLSQTRKQRRREIEKRLRMSERPSIEELSKPVCVYYCRKEFRYANEAEARKHHIQLKPSDRRDIAEKGYRIRSDRSIIWRDKVPDMIKKWRETGRMVYPGCSESASGLPTITWTYKDGVAIKHKSIAEAFERAFGPNASRGWHAQTMGDKSRPYLNTKGFWIWIDGVQPPEEAREAVFQRNLIELMEEV